MDSLLSPSTLVEMAQAVDKHLVIFGSCTFNETELHCFHPSALLPCWRFLSTSKEASCFGFCIEPKFNLQYWHHGKICSNWTWLNHYSGSMYGTFIEIWVLPHILLNRFLKTLALQSQLSWLLKIIFNKCHEVLTDESDREAFKAIKKKLLPRHPFTVPCCPA